MELRIKNRWEDAYIDIPIISIAYELCPEGRPIDIFIYGTKENLDKIIEEYAMIGANCRKVEEYEVPTHNKEYLEAVAKGEEVWQCIIARLPKFEVVNYHQAIYK